jgi:hypothetical protein
MVLYGAQILRAIRQFLQVCKRTYNIKNLTLFRAFTSLKLNESRSEENCHEASSPQPCEEARRRNKMANVLRAFLSRLSQSAVAVVPLAALGGAAYGVKESIYTGVFVR